MTNFKNYMLLGFVLFVFMAVGCKNKSTENEETAMTSEETQKPNIIIIYTDDLGYGDISSYGGTGVQTPAIDALAEETGFNSRKTFSDAFLEHSGFRPSQYLRNMPE